MSNENRALPLALGAGGGFLLWYFLHDRKRDSRAEVPSAPSANNTPLVPAVAAPATPAALPSPSPVPTGCVLRLDASGLTADGARVGVAEAVHRCKLAGRANVIVSREASAAAYADLMTALGQAGVPASPHRNGTRKGARTRPGSGRRKIVWPRTVDELDLPSFVQFVEALASDVEPDPNPDGTARGRFGDRKVFISAIRRLLRKTWYADLPRAAVDELLVRAHREGLLVLAGADLVAAMDPDEVADSEIRFRGAAFHFVVNEREPGAARNANTYRAFTLVTYTEGRKAGPRHRWFLADPPTTWADARERLGAAGILDRSLAGRTASPGGWMLSVDPTSFREELAEALPDGGSDGE